MKLISLENKLNKFENSVDLKTGKQLIVLIPGVKKIALGIVQTTIALGAFILSPLTVPFKCNFSIVRHSFRHIIHGIGNIACGLLQSIPIISRFTFFFRESREYDKKPIGHCESPSFLLSTGHENKLLAYETLVRRDMKVLVKSPGGRFGNMPYEPFYSKEACTVNSLPFILSKHPHASSNKIKKLFFKAIAKEYGKNPKDIACRKAYNSEVYMTDQLIRWDFVRNTFSKVDGSAELSLNIYFSGIDF